MTSYGRNKNHDDKKKNQKTKRTPIIAPAIAVRLLKKIGKIREVENHSITTRNYKITYYCDTKSLNNKNSQNKIFLKLE